MNKGIMTRNSKRNLLNHKLMNTEQMKIPPKWLLNDVILRVLYRNTSFTSKHMVSNTIKKKWI